MNDTDDMNHHMNGTDDMHHHMNGTDDMDHHMNGTDDMHHQMNHSHDHDHDHMDVTGPPHDHGDHTDDTHSGHEGHEEGGDHTGHEEGTDHTGHQQGHGVNFGRKYNIDFQWHCCKMRLDKTLQVFFMLGNQATILFEEWVTDSDKGKLDSQGTSEKLNASFLYTF